MDPTNFQGKLDGFRRRNSLHHTYLNKDVYRLLYTEELYIIAYNSIKSNDGAETIGSDGTCLDGFCMDWVHDLIASIRDESYKPNPNKIQLIPKSNGKMRKLCFPNGKDKLIQEAVRIILECIYEPTFSDLSHGFRPKRSIHTALAQIETWKGTSWFIEGDICACFDEVDHRVLENILRERICDERFIRLINKIVRAGYFDMQHQFHSTHCGTAQGSTCSPILANIYLNRLDQFMQSLINQHNFGKYRRQNKAYAKVHYQLKKFEHMPSHSNDDFKMMKVLRKWRSSLKSVDMFDPNFRRLRYVRYADDFLIAITGSKHFTTSIRDKVKLFLAEKLNLRLSLEKTKITHAHNDRASFLGYHISRGRNPRSTKANNSKESEIHIFMILKSKLAKLHSNGMCDSSGYPTSIGKLFCVPADRLINYGNQVLRGMMNNNQGTSNYFLGSRIQYIVQFSLAKTLARKFDISMKAVFKKYGKKLNVAYKTSNGRAKEICLALFKSFARNKYFFFNKLKKLKTTDTKPSYQSLNPLKRCCYICGNPHNTVMFHRKRISKLKVPFTPIVAEMIRINRRQIPVCRYCFDLAHCGKLEANQFKHSKFLLGMESRVQ